MTQTGLGATACASESQNWNGTIAALISRAVASRQKPAVMAGSLPAAATARAIAEKSSAPARA